MKIGEILSAYRTLIRARSQECALNDYELYLLMNSSANMIKQQILDKGQKLGFKNYHTITIDVEKTKFKSECQPDFLGCTVIKSVSEIPSTLVNKQGYELYVYSGQDKYNHMSFLRGARLRNHPMLKNYYDIIDNYLYLFKSKHLECITLQAAWEDVTNLEDYITSSNKPCYDPKVHEFPIEEQYIPLIYDYMDKKLGYYIQTNENRSL